MPPFSGRLGPSFHRQAELRGEGAIFAEAAFGEGLQFDSRPAAKVTPQAGMNSLACCSNGHQGSAMTMRKIHDSKQPGSNVTKGTCLRLAVKWASTHLCGSSDFSPYLADDQWLQAKEKQGEARSKGYKQYVDDRKGLGIPMEFLAGKPLVGVERARWASTVRKQQAYADESIAAEKRGSDAHAVDAAFVRSWSARVAAKQHKAIGQKAVDLQPLGNSVAEAVRQGALPAGGAALVLCCDFANSRTQGGHALGFIDPKLFDPNGGVHQSDGGSPQARLADVDQYIRDTYGPPVGVTCYTLTLNVND
jgi:hypothetical protein